MRCHFVWDEETKKKVLIPWCYGSMYQDDLSCCTCEVNKSVNQFEKEAYNKRVSELTEEIIYLQGEYDKLLKIIEFKNQKSCKKQSI